ncbi:MAG: putative DNA modification/repair radical SAM protein [Peptococcaceae bacterium]
MELTEKLRILGNAAKYDICASTATNKKHNIKGGFGDVFQHTVCHSFTPDGRCVNLLKVLMSNECQSDCFYCPSRKDTDIPRTSFAPEELSKLFVEFYKRNFVEGLFLSSGIKFNTSRTMEDMLKTCEMLRYKYRYNGYIHLKILPNASYDYVQRACQLANRVSINVEVPTQEHMSKLSNYKQLERDILHRMGWIKELSTLQKSKNITQSTQFIVGAAGEDDKTIINSMAKLLQDFNLTRSYFSTFVPIENTPLENNAPAESYREGKLYQADFLLRIYKYRPADFVFEKNGNLPGDIDVKLAIALNNPAGFPREINSCNYSQLIKIPGIGPQTGQRIMALRKNGIKISSLGQLKKIGAAVNRTQFFITINGKTQGNINVLHSKILLDRERSHYKQMSLF